MGRCWGRGRISALEMGSIMWEYGLCSTGVSLPPLRDRDGRATRAVGSSCREWPGVMNNISRDRRSPSGLFPGRPPWRFRRVGLNKS